MKAKTEVDLKKLTDANHHLMVALRLMTQMTDMKLGGLVCKAINAAMDITDVGITDKSKQLQGEESHE